MSGWGTIPYGTGPFGFGLWASLFIVDTFVLNERMIRVILSRQPQATSPIVEHDVLNPRSWEITRGDTGEAYTVMGAALVAPQTVDIYTLQKWGDIFVEHTVSAPDLFDSSGNPIVLPFSDTFKGCVARKLSATPQGQVDLLNPQFPDQDGTGGALVIGSSGDYQHESGIPFLRKLIIRRLVTDIGGFFHLDQYGLGLRAKQATIGSDLQRLKGLIERQVALEPEFSAVRATLRLTPTGILYIGIKARLSSSNEEVQIEIKAGVQNQ